MGLHAATTQWVMFLDGDDLLTKSSIEFRCQAATTHPSAEMIIFKTATFIKMIGDSKVLWNTYTGMESLENLKLRFINQDMPWHTNGVLWNKNFCARTGGWDEQLHSWQDWELHLRSLFHKPRLEFIDAAPDNYYRMNSINAISNAKNVDRYYKSVAISIKSIYERYGTSFSKEMNRSYYSLVIRALLIYPLRKGNNAVVDLILNDDFFPNGILTKTDFKNKSVLIKVTSNYLINKVYKMIFKKSYVSKFLSPTNFLKNE
jgi:hypothetical protein